MSCGALEPGTPVEYCYGASFVPCRVLYAVGELCFCRFETARWPGYTGFANYVTVAVFPEHLRPAEERPQTTDARSSDRSDEQRSRETPNEPEVSKASAASEPKPEKNGLKSAGGNGQSPESISAVAKLKFPTRSPTPVRSIGGLTLRDFLGNR